MSKPKGAIKVRYTAVNKWYAPAWGALLPNGNAVEFPGIRAMLRARGVEFAEMPAPGGGRWFMFPATERRKLPKDERPGWRRRCYLPTSKGGGHSVYPVTVFQIASVYSVRYSVR